MRKLLSIQSEIDILLMIYEKNSGNIPQKYNLEKLKVQCCKTRCPDYDGFT